MLFYTVLAAELSSPDLLFDTLHAIHVHACNVMHVM